MQIIRVMLDLSDPNFIFISCQLYMAVWPSGAVFRVVRSPCVGSNPVVGITNHKPAVNSAVHPSEVGK